MTEVVKLKIKLNGVETEVEGKTAVELQKHTKRAQDIALIEEKLKDMKKEHKKGDSMLEAIFTESEIRFNDENTIDVMSITGNAVAESFKVTSKAAPKKTNDLINKKALVSMISDGLQDGWITIDSDSILDYLMGHQFETPLTKDQLEETLTALDFVTLISKVRVLPVDKQELNIETVEENK